MDKAEFLEALQGDGYAVDDAELAVAAECGADDVAVSATISAWAGSLTDDQRSGFLARDPEMSTRGR